MLLTSRDPHSYSHISAAPTITALCLQAKSGESLLSSIHFRYSSQRQTFVGGTNQPLRCKIVISSRLCARPMGLAHFHEEALQLTILGQGRCEPALWTWETPGLSQESSAQGR